MPDPPKNHTDTPELQRPRSGETGADESTSLVASADGGATSPPIPNLFFTSFYERHCYKILSVVAAVNVLGGIYFFLSAPQTAWSNVISLLIITLSPFGVLFYLVEEKGRIAVSKRIATFLVAVSVAAIQVLLGTVKDQRYRKLSIITDSADVASFRAAFKTVRRNDYRPGSVAVDEIQRAVPRLEGLSKKYPYHRQVLYALGLGQFELHKYGDARATFSQLNDLYPNEFLSHYYLGISLKNYADELQEAQMDKAGLKPFYCGSPTGPWMRSWTAPADIDELRLEALEHLSHSLDYYYESTYDEEQKLGIKIARNMGWLHFQRSNWCENRSECAQAIYWHDKALGREVSDNFTGDPNYILAWNNLGDIYRAMGDLDKSYSSFWRAYNLHRKMLADDPQGAKSGNYECLYRELAEFLHEDNDEAQAQAVTAAGRSVFE